MPRLCNDCNSSQSPETPMVCCDRFEVRWQALKFSSMARLPQSGTKERYSTICLSAWYYTLLIRQFSRISFSTLCASCQSMLRPRACQVLAKEQFLDSVPYKTFSFDSLCVLLLGLTKLYRLFAILEILLNSRKTCDKLLWLFQKTVQKGSKLLRHMLSIIARQPGG